MTTTEDDDDDSDEDDDDKHWDDNNNGDEEAEPGQPIRVPECRHHKENWTNQRRDPGANAIRAYVRVERRRQRWDTGRER